VCDSSARPGGIYSYFNGLAPDNIFFHTVYCRLASAELASLGFHTAFQVCPIDTADPKIWRGVKRRGWAGAPLLRLCTTIHSDAV
jgi:protein arginine N-methyltransferase 2